MKAIYVVTHGDKFSGANPGMTEKGFRQVKALRPLLPEASIVVCGTGRRHLDVADALNAHVDRYTSVVGGPDSGESSVKGQPVDIVRLPDDSIVAYSKYTTLQDTAPAMCAVICSLPNNAVVCAGRPSMIMLGMHENESKSAAVYRVEVADGGIMSITEVVATGPAEVHAV